MNPGDIVLIQFSQAEWKQKDTKVDRQFNSYWRVSYETEIQQSKTEEQ